MKSIRFNTFETNSSSTHSVTLMSLDDFNKFTSNKLFYDLYDDKLVTLNEIYSDCAPYLDGMSFTEFQNIAWICFDCCGQLNVKRALANILPNHEDYETLVKYDKKGTDVDFLYFTQIGLKQYITMKRYGDYNITKANIDGVNVVGLSYNYLVERYPTLKTWDIPYYLR